MAEEAVPPAPTAAGPDEESLRAALAGVIDPELGADIVELGMVRGVAVDAEGAVEVEIALTVGACGPCPGSGP